MSGDIEEFLRRAAARRAQQQGQGQQQKQQQRPAAEQGQGRKRPAPIEILDDEVLEVEIVEQGISNLVDQHLNTSDFATRAQAIGRNIGQAEKQVESRLQSTFDHDLGRLASQPKEPSEQAPPAEPPTDLLKLLSSPQSIKQAIILSEILNPPSHRWD